MPCFFLYGIYPGAVDAANTRKARCGMGCTPEDLSDYRS